MFKKETLLLIALVAVVIGVLVINKGTNQPNLNSPEYVRKALTEYVDKKSTNNEILPDDLGFSVHPAAYTYATNNAGEEIRDFFTKITSEREAQFRTLYGMEYIRFVSELFVIGTPFQGRVNINSPPEIDSINIYFLNSDSSRLSRHFEGNCAFIGHYHTIICDANFIGKIINDLDQIQKTYDIVLYTPEGAVDLAKDKELQKAIVDRLKGNVITWILGHEIGHAVLHYNLVVEDKEQLHFDLTYDKKEEADIYVAKKIVLSEGRASEFKTILGEFIHQEYRKEYRKSNPELSRNKILEMESRDFPLNSTLAVEQSKYKVPLLLRALHVIDALLKVAPNHDETGYFSAIENSIEIKKSIL